MWELVQITAQYSNAVLLAVLPHVSDFAHKLDLPVPTPLTPAAVREFKCDPRAGETGGAIVLSNGSIFTFLEGRVCVFRSPNSYYSLQDPERIPAFYGTVKLTEQQALSTARQAIKKLGYRNSMFNADVDPMITRPEKTEDHWIPRYLFRWLDPNWVKLKDTTSIVPALLEVEINASNGCVEMWITTSRETRKPSPHVDVTPPSLKPPPAKVQLSGGQQTTPVSEAFSAAFLNAILPQLSDLIATLGVDIPIPITTNSLVLEKYACRILDGQPMSQLYLTNGDRFNYQHGYFAAYYAHDAMDKFPETGNTDDFLGHIKITTNQAISLCEGVLRKLGYTKGLSSPCISYAPAKGDMRCTRFTYLWRYPGQQLPFASFEVDMGTKSIKSMYLNDASFRGVTPKIDLPTATNIPPPKEIHTDNPDGSRNLEPK